MMKRSLLFFSVTASVAPLLLSVVVGVPFVGSASSIIISENLAGWRRYTQCLDTIHNFQLVNRAAVFLGQLKDWEDYFEHQICQSDCHSQRDYVNYELRTVNLNDMNYFLPKKQNISIETRVKTKHQYQENS